MPQMSPIWWSMLFMMFIITYIMFMIIMYFYISYNMPKKMMLKNKNNMNWLW